MPPARTPVPMGQSSGRGPRRFEQVRRSTPTSTPPGAIEAIDDDAASGSALLEPSLLGSARDRNRVRVRHLRIRKKVRFRSSGPGRLRWDRCPDVSEHRLPAPTSSRRGIPVAAENRGRRGHAIPKFPRRSHPCRSVSLERDERGMDNIPVTGRAIVAPNHISVLDSVLRPAWGPALARPGDAWTTGRPGFIFPAMGMIPIDRSGCFGHCCATHTAGCLEAGELFGIYPEAPGARDGLLQYSHTSVARLPCGQGRRSCRWASSVARCSPGRQVPAPFRRVYIPLRSPDQRGKRYQDRPMTAWCCARSSTGHVGSQPVGPDLRRQLRHQPVWSKPVAACHRTRPTADQS